MQRKADRAKPRKARQERVEPHLASSWIPDRKQQGQSRAQEKWRMRKSAADYEAFLPADAARISGKFMENFERGMTSSKPADLACSARPVCTWDRNPIIRRLGCEARKC